jgi:hypothetical protein
MDGTLFTSRSHLGGAYCWCVHYSHTMMAWVLWKSLASTLLYIDVSVCPSSEALFFFGHLLSCFNHLEAPVL